ncbi:hypothetical protein B0H19DRAFT_1249109 [Mycena capillaripes]|nr:hypothetical protein B0H19DRAFT_1249109 [Mycena capillaripes]
MASAAASSSASTTKSPATDYWQFARQIPNWRELAPLACPRILEKKSRSDVLELLKPAAEFLARGAKDSKALVNDHNLPNELIGFWQGMRELAFYVDPRQQQPDLHKIYWKVKFAEEPDALSTVEANSLRQLPPIPVKKVPLERTPTVKASVPAKVSGSAPAKASGTAAPAKDPSLSSIGRMPKNPTPVEPSKKSQSTPASGPSGKSAMLPPPVPTKEPKTASGQRSSTVSSGSQTARASDTGSTPQSAPSTSEGRKRRKSPAAIVEGSPAKRVRGSNPADPITDLELPSLRPRPIAPPVKMEVDPPVVISESSKSKRTGGKKTKLTPAALLNSDVEDTPQYKDRNQKLASQRILKQVGIVPVVMQMSPAPRFSVLSADFLLHSSQDHAKRMGRRTSANALANKETLQMFSALLPSVVRDDLPLSEDGDYRILTFDDIRQVLELAQPSAGPRCTTCQGTGSVCHVKGFPQACHACIRTHGPRVCTFETGGEINNGIWSSLKAFTDLSSSAIRESREALIQSSKALEKTGETWAIQQTEHNFRFLKFLQTIVRLRRTLTKDFFIERFTSPADAEKILRIAMTQNVVSDKIITRAWTWQYFDLEYLEAPIPAFDSAYDFYAAYNSSQVKDPPGYYLIPADSNNPDLEAHWRPLKPSDFTHVQLYDNELPSGVDGAAIRKATLDDLEVATDREHREEDTTDFNGNPNPFVPPREPPGFFGNLFDANLRDPGLYLDLEAEEVPPGQESASEAESVEVPRDKGKGKAIQSDSDTSGGSDSSSYSSSGSEPEEVPLIRRPAPRRRRPAGEANHSS